VGAGEAILRRNLKKETQMIKRIVSLVAISVALLYSSNPVVVSARPPSVNVPLRVTIEGNPNMPGAYSVVGDGRDYVDGEEGVSALLSSSTNDFLMDPTNRGVSNPRALWFIFSDKIADGNIANPWFGAGPTKIDSYLNFNEILTVPVGTIQERSGGFGLYPSKKTSYAVRFNPNNPSAPNFALINDPNFTAAVLVSHPDCNTWILTPKATTPYADFGYGSGTGAVCTLISFSPNSAGQYLMPFQITLTRKTPIACP
jgi:hypothetical protein